MLSAVCLLWSTPTYNSQGYKTLLQKKNTQWGRISSGWTHLCKQNGRKLEDLSYIGRKRLGFVWKQHLLPTPNVPLPLHKQTQYPFLSLRIFYFQVWNCQAIAWSCKLIHVGMKWVLTENQKGVSCSKLKPTLVFGSEPYSARPFSCSDYSKVHFEIQVHI